MSDWDKMLWKHDIIAFLICVGVAVIPFLIHLVLCAIVNLNPSDFSKDSKK
jgi:L-cystine uptake protein TcyP (sodium:dicarboxylate symporter family)